MPSGERMVIRAFYEHERAEVEILFKKNQKVFPVVDILNLAR
jgi:hypothetical protein